MRKASGVGGATAAYSILFSCFEFNRFMILITYLVLVTPLVVLWQYRLRDGSCATATGPIRKQEPSNATSRPRPLPPSNNNKRTFQAYGRAAALFVHFGAYRGGPTTFAVVGSASKPIHSFSKPWFRCQWISNNPNSTVVKTKGVALLPDYGFGRVYTAVIINCTFRENPNADNSGGKLFLQAFYSASPRKYERILAMEESPGSYDESKFRPPFPYEYIYCGSPLFGTVSPKRIREWIAYHMHFFGPKTYFVMFDAGGVSPAVRKVLEPWMELGRLTLHDIRGQEEFDTYYYNQYVVLNDCLHRHRHTANWTFYFDVDEYLYLPGGNTLESVLQELDEYTQFTIEQNLMSGKLCTNNKKKNHSSEWGFEKIVFRDSITDIWRDRKYAIKARNAYAAGIHMSEYVNGKTLHKTETMIRYYHYHNSINILGEVCRQLVPAPENGSKVWFEKVPYLYDDNMTHIAATIKQFEKQTIGTRQEFLSYG